MDVQAKSIQQHVADALEHVERTKSLLGEGDVVAAKIEYGQASRILDKEIPTHPGYLTFWQKANGPFYEVYVALIQLVAEQSAKFQDLQAEPLAEPAAAPKTEGDALAERLEKLRVSRNPKKSSEVKRKPVSQESTASNEVPGARRDVDLGRQGSERGHSDSAARSLNIPPNVPSQGFSSAYPQQNGSASSLSNGLASTNGIPVRGPIQKRPVPPTAFVLTAQQLEKLLAQRADDVLLLDVRHRDDFNASHIDAPHVVGIDPVTLRSGISDADLEDSLVLATESESRDFAMRLKFGSVVFFDHNSSIYPPPATERLYHLHSLLAQSGIQPLMLAGGFDAWVQEGLPCIATQKEHSKQAAIEQQRGDRISGGRYDFNVAADAPQGDWSISAGQFDRVTAPPRASSIKHISNNRGPAMPEKPMELRQESTEGKVGLPQNRQSGMHIRDGYADSPRPVRYPSISKKLRTPASHEFSNGAVVNGSQHQHQSQANSGLSLRDSSLSRMQFNGHKFAKSSSPAPQGGDSHRGSLVHQMPQQQYRPNNVPPSQMPRQQNGAQFAPQPPPHGSSILVTPSYNMNGRSQQLPMQASQNNHFSTLPRMGRGPVPVPVLGPSTGSQVQPQPQQQLSMVPAKSKLGAVTGLRNLGNTCYMNCILQCLLGTPELVLPFLDATYAQHVNTKSRLGYSGRLANEFAALSNAVMRPGGGHVAPYSFKRLIGELRDTFQGDEQQDCQEFLTFLLDGLHEDMNSNGNKDRLPDLTESHERFRERLSVRTASTIEWERYLKANTSLIVDNFQGQYLSRLQCTVCGTTSTTYSAFCSLSLPLVTGSKNMDLLECFNLFVAPEVLDDDDAWYCSSCKKKQRTIKTLQISRLPKILVVHLKRFRRTMRSVDKLETPVRYPLNNLDLTSYWPKPDKNPQELDSRLQRLPVRGQVPPFQYDLYGVTSHDGSLKSGHYTAFVKKQGSWFHFDDTSVTRVPESAVNTKNAYVLFFRRHSHPQEASL